MALTHDQSSRLGKVLDARYGVLLEEVRDQLEKSENQQYIELIGREPADAGDASVGDALADLNLGIIDRHIQELRDIEAAKARLKEGSYGVCIDCQMPIDIKRLLAYPTAKRCLTCQGKQERTFAHASTPKL